jgi:cell division protein FtsI (penicillin-binding protein 3)
MKRAPSKKWLQVRIALICCFFILVFGAIIIRAYQLQVIEQDKLTERIKDQYLKYVKLLPKRGTIYDRNKKVLARSLEVDSVYAHPGKIQDKQGIAKKLSPILQVSYKYLIDKLTSDRPFVWLMRKISPAQAQKIEKLKLKGVGFIQESKRFYPNKELAGHCLGFVGTDLKGLEGIELAYDSYLNGQEGYILVERDAHGRNIHTQDIKQVNATKGYNLQLTIDNTIQYFVEKVLDEGVTQKKAQAGIAIVMVPQTGEILALAVRPTFNPNNFLQYTPSQWRNRAVTDAYEPGSTFKTFLVSSALEEGISEPHDIFFCENGSYPLGDSVIHDVHEYGWLSLTRIIKHSSNIGACKVAENLGKEKFYSYIRKFGFGDKTGIDLPGETSGLLPMPYRWSSVDLGAISFGQGISISPLQLITAFSAIANNGLMMKPHLVKAIFNDQGGIIKKIDPEERGRIISHTTSRQVTSMLETVVEEGGTGVNASITGFSIAGKTGTAQKVDGTTNQYSDHKVASSFIGFLPADDPKLSILIIIDEPQGISYGGTVAAPIFKKAAHQIIDYLHITPPKMAKTHTAPSTTVRNTVDTTDLFKRVSAHTPASVPRIPDFSGLSMREVKDLAEKHNLSVKLIGSGVACEQHPSPGVPIEHGGSCQITFQPLS